MAHFSKSIVITTSAYLYQFLFALIVTTITINATPTWNAMPTTPAVLVSDARWHELSPKEQSIMLHILDGTAADIIVKELSENITAYKKISGLYDLLAIAINKNSNAFLFFLLSQGVAITDQAIFESYKIENAYILSKLFKFGLNPNHKLSNGDTLFIDAIKNNRIEVIRLLLDQEAIDTSLVDATDKTAFDYITINTFDYGYQTYKFIEIGLNPNHVLSNGDRLLLAAIKHSRFDIAEALLSAGADISIVNSNDKTVFHYVAIDDFADAYGYYYYPSIYKHLSTLQKSLYAIATIDSESFTTGVIFTAFVAIAAAGYYQSRTT